MLVKDRDTRGVETAALIHCLFGPAWLGADSHSLGSRRRGTHKVVDKDRSLSDAVPGIRTVAIPGLQIEDSVGFMSVLLRAGKEANQFITEEQRPSQILLL